MEENKAEANKAEEMSALAAFAEGFIQLPAVRQLGILLGFAAVAAFGVGLVLWSWVPSYTVLFGGMGEKEAVEVAQLLEGKGLEYKLDERTGAIMVPSGKVHEIRLELASEGYPKSSSVGLEILQNKSEFGTSQFLEMTRYQHALEAELARSVMTLSSVQSARVHLALPKQSVFVRKRQQPTASVLVDLYAGRSLEDGQVDAISHLVASSIPNLEPERVTIVDKRGRLLSNKKRNAQMALSQEQFQYNRKVEGDYIARIEDILAPIVGRDGMRAQVTAELDFTVTEQTQESYNPDIPALRSEQVAEEQNLGGVVQGVPGALTNQPPGVATVPEEANTATGPDGEQRERLSSRKNTTTNYELDRTISHSRMATGQVKRLSIAVVVDDRLVTNEEGTVVREPRSTEEMARLTSLVREAVGYNIARGDSVNVLNTTFADDTAYIAAAGGMPEMPIWEEPWVLDVGKVAGAILLGMLLILAVIRPMMRNLSTLGRLQEEQPEPVPQEEVKKMLPRRDPMEGLVKLPEPGAYEDNIAMVKQVVHDDPKLVAQVVRNWISNE